MNQIQKNNFTSIEQMTGQFMEKKVPAGKNLAMEKGLSFQEILRNTRTEEKEALKFSKHANQRLASRNIDLSGEQMERLANGTSKAREKGIQESLVMVDNLAFIVNVKNNTVITAVNDTEDAVFTNIDGAVIS